ncbi:uncharacterized protein NECHADRAFT_77436 [Fusarium vanettenii 77-13-4]|uniref:Uncharacterized protein n=1 Tax=Fusarium vanettenii (strain ATCC MYA-4622 / CBS 123669 / FGSC 9596 / NRRL 45880 / 77-13-4) TaxID=660122 RepID=C7YL80_FUSV7|nr:uncharacterized protein NECHADRAFT_77436 [Fusarium vanettenii 77-13-4]EEU46742.1 predicted protein [Fusarium vanettenii 77-13-4]
MDFKTESLKDHAFSDEEDEVFLSATSRPSTLGRCACGSICNHAATTVSAPAPATTPIIKADHSSTLGLGSRDIEVIDLVSDDEQLPSLESLQRGAKRATARCSVTAPESKRQTLLAASPSVPSPATSTWRPTTTVTRATPEWPLPTKMNRWLRELKDVYNSNPSQFYRHIDSWFEDFETKVRLGRVDDYSNWVALNYGEPRCFTSAYIGDKTSIK